VTSRRSSAAVGAAGLLVLVLVLFALTRFLGGQFKSGYEVTATFARAGQLLRPTSDVKLRGVLVGEVTGITVERSGRARVTLRLFVDQKIPDNVNAAIRAKTLFGEKYVAFATPPEPSRRLLRQGSQIPESRTVPPLEVETVLARAVPVLNAIDPPQFAAALHALAQGFVGNTDQLRRATVQSETLLTQTERTLPNLERNLVHLKYFASALNQSDTDLLRALGGLTAVGDVLRAHPQEFDATLRNLVPLATNLGDILTARQTDLSDLAGKGRVVLDQVANRAQKLPNLVSALDGFLGVWVADLSQGPNWRIFVTTAPASGHTYPPGTEPLPEPRATAMRRITGGHTSITDLADVLLAAVPTQDLRRIPSPRLPVLRPLPLVSL
jgi:phospholipid/cholesterol/gamma-HCH transport system substrate-binding protein